MYVCKYLYICIYIYKLPFCLVLGVDKELGRQRRHHHLTLPACLQTDIHTNLPVAFLHAWKANWVHNELTQSPPCVCF